MSEFIGGPVPQPTNQPKPPKKRHVLRTVALIVGGLFAVGIVAAVLTPGTPAKDAAKAPVGVTSKAAPTTTAAKPTREAHSPASKPTQTAPVLTAGQEQAVGKAESYLEFTAFSRKGLIRQLSSDAGEGFSVKDATFAVDHLKVDWNEQAAKAALEYLAVTHFSRSGLIEQLESSFGSGFTHAQAVYGVTKAGL